MKKIKKLGFYWSEEELFGTMVHNVVIHPLEKRCLLYKGNWTKLMVLGLVAIVTLFLCEQVDARKKRKRFISPVKVEEVATLPEPFIIGQSPLTLSMMVKVPLSNVDGRVLEVSALITSPTRRTMSFVSQRLPLAEATQGGLLRLIPVELVWDGKDQYGRLVADGSYFYEIQAKVMEDKGIGPRTKIVSRRVQGTLEVLAYVGEVLPLVPPEPEVPAEIEALQQKELAEEDPSLTESGETAEESSAKPGEDAAGEEGALVLEGSSGGDSAQESLNGAMKDLVPEVSGEELSEEADSVESLSVEPEASSPMVDPLSEHMSEPSPNPIPTEPSLPSSEENPSQH
jgi:hypothetical protein